jgi:hypothetical protein
LGLFEPEGSMDISYSTLIQTFHRFILEQVHRDIGEVDGAIDMNIYEYVNMSPRVETENPVIQIEPEPKKEPRKRKTSKNNIKMDTKELKSALQQIAGLPSKSVSKCEACGNEASRWACGFNVELSYTRKTNKPTKLTFQEALQQSIHREISTKAWCDYCKKYQLLTQYKRLLRLPCILGVNANITNESDFACWLESQGNLFLSNM